MYFMYKLNKVLFYTFLARSKSVKVGPAHGDRLSS